MSSKSIRLSLLRISAAASAILAFAGCSSSCASGPPDPSNPSPEPSVSRPPMTVNQRVREVRNGPNFQLKRKPIGEPVIVDAAVVEPAEH